MEARVPDEPGLTQLEAERARLYAELSGVGDFRRGTLSAVFRRCGKANCRCAQPGERGHGPQWNWVRWAGGKTVTAHPRPGPELDKALREAGAWERFKELSGQIEAVNEAICGARPPLAQPGGLAPGTQGQKKGSSARNSPRRSRPRPPSR
jgi:hypothetical protein